MCTNNRCLLPGFDQKLFFSSRQPLSHGQNVKTEIRMSTFPSCSANTIFLLCKFQNIPLSPEKHQNTKRCSGFTCCSHRSAQTSVNHSPFSAEVLDTPISHNSDLESDSAAAPAGPRVCFIHRVTDGVIQKAVIFTSDSSPRALTQ